jgi:hypothetical protein
MTMFPVHHGLSSEAMLHGSPSFLRFLRFFAAIPVFLLPQFPACAFSAARCCWNFFTFGATTSWQYP